MRKIKCFVLLTTVFLSRSLVAQDIGEKEDFTPSGNPSMKIFTNYHSNFTESQSDKVFEITRAYFGYDYHFSKNFSGKILFDVGNPDAGSLQMTTYLKNACLTYETNGLTINFGLIGLLQFKEQENAWGYRYIYKSFQDQHKFNSSADLGFNAIYKFSGFLSMDFTLSNGEGYKTAKVDTTLRTGLGATIIPLKQLKLRVYHDYMKKSGVAQQTMVLFAAYSLKYFSIGAEYNKQLNNKYAKNKDLIGYSFYATYKANKKIKIFGRYDRLSSNNIAGSDWNLAKNGSAIIAGFEYNPTKGVKIAPNYQGWVPKDDLEKMIAGFYLNLEFKF